MASDGGTYQVENGCTNQEGDCRNNNTGIGIGIGIITQWNICCYMLIKPGVYQRNVLHIKIDKVKDRTRSHIKSPTDYFSSKEGQLIC